MSANASIGYCSRCNSWILWRCVDTQSGLERGEWPLILNENFEFAKADGDMKRAFNGTNAHHVDFEGQNPKWTSRASSKSSGPTTRTGSAARNQEPSARQRGKFFHRKCVDD